MRALSSVSNVCVVCLLHVCVIGAFPICPPEWFNKSCYEADSATVWSLGIVLSKMLMGTSYYVPRYDIDWDEIHLRLPCSEG